MCSLFPVTGVLQKTDFAAGGFEAFLNTETQQVQTSTSLPLAARLRVHAGQVLESVSTMGDFAAQEFSAQTLEDYAVLGFAVQDTTWCGSTPASRMLLGFQTYFPPLSSLYLDCVWRTLTVSSNINVALQYFLAGLLSTSSSQIGLVVVAERAPFRRHDTLRLEVPTPTKNSIELSARGRLALTIARQGLEPRGP